jgi:CRP/FNR family transcriptional regulator, cyclic AMP receptor protein
MRTIEELLGEVPALEALTPEHRDTVAGCARNQVFDPGARIMREGEPADAFYVIRAGQVALGTVMPGRGEVILQTLHDGELLGWSWLVPPYRNAFDARALEHLSALAFDGACLRGKCAEDAVLGYALLERFAAVIVERLQATRMRLLDLYGEPGR